MVEDYLADAVDVLESQLQQEVEGEQGGPTPQQVHQCAEALHKKFKTACDKNFDKFEIYLKRNVFAIPPGITVIPPPEAQPAAETLENMDTTAEAMADSDAHPAAEPEVGMMDLDDEPLSELEQELFKKESELDAEIASAEQEIASLVSGNLALQNQIQQSLEHLEKGRDNINRLDCLSKLSAKPQEVQAILSSCRELQEALRNGELAAQDLAAQRRQRRRAETGGAIGPATPATPRRVGQLRLGMDNANLQSVKRFNARLFNSAA
mmetsp:Transcript_18303/g.58298  ORF Transcript_18303/g.58298 Transcript_18303/m.58298 type:complete len:266 (+) Transcript_18303:325-1122(+)